MPPLTARVAASGGGAAAGPLRPWRQSQQTQIGFPTSMMRLAVAGLDEARLPASLGRRQAPRARRPAAVPQAAATGAGGGSGEVQKLHTFLSTSAPQQQQQQQQQQQGLSAADAYQAALPAPLVEDWSRLRIRRHLRLRRIEVELPPALAEQYEQQQAQQCEQQQQQEQPLQPQQHQQQQRAPAEAAAQQQVAVMEQPVDAHASQAEVQAVDAAAAVQAAPQAEQPAAVVAVQQEAQQPVQQQQQQQPPAQQRFALPHMSAERLSTVASDAAGRVGQLAQQTQAAAQGAAIEAAALGRQQLASLQHLSARQLGNLQQAAWHARQQLAAGAHRLQGKLQAQQSTAVSAAQQQAAPVAAEPAAEAAVAVQTTQGHQAASMQQQLQRAEQQQQRAEQQQRAASDQAASSQRPQQHMQQVVAQAPQGRLVHPAAAVAVPPPPPPPLPWQAAVPASLPGSFQQWLLAACAAAAMLAVAALRWLTGQRRQRSPRDEIREAEQRARAARLYDRQRQRFQRALLAAEDLEGADTSVFNAVSRKGAAGAAGGGAAAGGAAGTGAVVLPPAAEAAVSEFVGPVHSMASVDADDDGYAADGSTDVFDPASWDEETRKQWDAFVSSSKVNKGKLWDTNQVDEGLPAVWVDLNK